MPSRGQVAEVEQRALGGVVEADDPDARRRAAGSASPADPATSAIGTCSTAPADALATVGVTWTARWRGRSTPCDAGAVAAADDRAEVAGVGDAVDGDEERRLARAPPRSGRARSASGSGAAKAITPCGASLRASCVELAAGDVGDRHAVGAGEGDDVGDAVVGLAVVADELGRQPELVDLAAPGDQQLAHRLASLDLLAAEALAPAASPGAAARPSPRRTGPVRPAPSAARRRRPRTPACEPRPPAVAARRPRPRRLTDVTPA